MRLFLVRHGQTAWNIAGRAQGHTDIPLDPTGLEQAERLVAAFDDVQLDRILSSDLGRAVQTAQPLSNFVGIPIEKRRDLRERAFGEWEGDDFAIVGKRMLERAEELGVSPQEVRPPGGESYGDVWARLANVVREIDQEDGNILVVAHGGTASLLLAQMVRGNLDTSRSFRFANTGYCELHRRIDGLYNLIRYNETSHLAARALTGSLDGTSR